MAFTFWLYSLWTRAGPCGHESPPCGHESPSQVPGLAEPVHHRPVGPAAIKVGSGARSDHSGRLKCLWLTLSGRLGPIHACICPCGGGAHGVASDSRFACRGRGNGAALTLGTRARSDLRCAVGSLTPRSEQPRLACDVAAHLLHQRRGGPASLPACSGVRARMLTAGGPARCSSLASACPLRLPCAITHA